MSHPGSHGQQKQRKVVVQVILPTNRPHNNANPTKQLIPTTTMELYQHNGGENTLSHQKNETLQGH